MRILHTSDWHLNDRLHWIDRQPDIRARLQEIANYLEEYQVDVMTVAGDLFSQRSSRLADLRGAVQDVNEAFSPFLRRGGTIVAISGNHDDEALFELLKTAQDLSAPISLDPDRSCYPPGRMYLATKPTYLPLKGASDEQVQFILLPYPTAYRYLPADVQPNSIDERHSCLRTALLERLAQLRARRLDEGIASVLVAHLHIRGGELHSLYKLSEKEDVIFDLGDLPMNWAYAAFGHIHRAQAIGRSEHVRYSGSIERMDLGERNDDKSVVLVEIKDNQRVGEPLLLPLRATPIYQFEITDPDREVPSLAARFPDAREALVYYKVHYRPGTHNINAIRDAINKQFRACCYCETIPYGSTVGRESPEVRLDPEKAFPERVRDYLAQHLLPADHDREELLTLADKLLVEEG